MYRKGTLKDCKAVYDLICEMECSQLPYDYFYEIYKKQMDDAHYYCLVCEYDNSIIGVLNLRFEEQLHHAASIAEALEFAIHSSYRKKGIGKEMLSAACKLAKETGCIQIELDCNQLRTDTHRFYLREGMKNSHFKFTRALTNNYGGAAL